MRSQASTGLAATFKGIIFSTSALLEKKMQDRNAITQKGSAYRGTGSSVRFHRFLFPQYTMAGGKMVEATETHHLYIRTVPGEVKAEDDDYVSED